MARTTFARAEQMLHLECHSCGKLDVLCFNHLHRLANLLSIDWAMETILTLFC